jgi:tetratricopeptide (TPR) repeat protein
MGASFGLGVENNEAAHTYLHRAIEVHFALGGTKNAWYANYLGSLGWAQRMLLQFSNAEQSLRESAEIMRRLAKVDNALYFYARASEGELALRRGDTTHAHACLQDLEATPVNPTNLFATAWLYLLRGLLALARNDYVEARGAFEEVIAWRSRWSAINFTALFLNYAAQTALQAQTYDDAISCFEEVKALTRDLGNLTGMAYAYLNAANATLQKGDSHLAKSQLAENLQYNESIDHLPGILIDVAGVAELAIHEGQLESAAKLVGFVRQHCKPSHNSIYSLRHVDLSSLVDNELIETFEEEQI